MTVYLPHFTTTIAVAIQIKLFNVQIMLKGWLVYHLLGLIEISVCDFFFLSALSNRFLWCVGSALLCQALLHFIFTYLECQISEVSLCFHLCR